MGTTKATEDMVSESYGTMVKEAYGKENVEFYQMEVVKGCRMDESYLKVEMEVFHGDWM